MDRYPAKYTDANGSEETSIANDGKILRMIVRGVEFTGACFDSLEPVDGAAAEKLATFTLHHGSLCSCQIKCRIPVPIHDNGKESSGSLHLDLQLGAPAANGGIDKEDVSIVLQYNEQRYPGPGKSGWVEDELIEIQKKLPGGVFMRTCINCLYSDYSPYGHGLFGYLMCFRNIKQEYLKVTSKNEFWSVHNRYDRLVQEIYLCSEFKKRVPGTGYRG